MRSPLSHSTARVRPGRALVREHRFRSSFSSRSGGGPPRALLPQTSAGCRRRPLPLMSLVDVRGPASGRGRSPAAHPAGRPTPTRHGGRHTATAPDKSDLSLASSHLLRRAAGVRVCAPDIGIVKNKASRFGALEFLRKGSFQ